MSKFIKGLGIVALALVLNLGAAQARGGKGGGWHGGGWHGALLAAIAEVTTEVVGAGADLLPVQFSADCLQRPTITGAAPITTIGAALITTDLQRAAQWLTACDVSNRMILVAERI